jgi:Arc/MetJ family transcription regulator
MKRCIAMRTNVVIDDGLMKEALNLSRAKTKKAVIHEALGEFVNQRKRLELKEIRGKIRFASRYNYKKMRSR